MAVVNASGVVQDSYTYDIYGTPMKTGSLANELDFAGQQTDGTGLQYLRARYYDPATGTFLSRDPLTADPGRIENPISYGSASPVGLSDPTGLDSCSRYFPCIPKCIFFDCPTARGVAETVAALLDGSGNAVVSLVKLAGEYSIVVGEGFWDALTWDPDLTKLIFSNVLGAVATACIAGAVTAGTTCAIAVAAYAIYIGWQVSGILSSDDQSTNERSIRLLIEAVNDWPGVKGINAFIQAIFGAFVSALQPQEVR
jgi:RHS repeat-associated protein